MQLQLKSQEVHGNKDYLETGWESTIEEVRAALPNARTKPAQLKPPAYQDRFRMTSCSGTSMGIKVCLTAFYASTHLHQVICIKLSTGHHSFRLIMALHVA